MKKKITGRDLVKLHLTFLFGCGYLYHYEEFPWFVEYITAHIRTKSNWWWGKKLFHRIFFYKNCLACQGQRMKVKII